jgi:hypothetical protein
MSYIGFPQTIKQVSNINLEGEYVRIPEGTTTQRDNNIPSPQSGMFRFNTTVNEFEGYTGSEWKNFDTVLANDLSPELGADLDVSGQSIVSSANGDISILPDGTGQVLIDGDGTNGGVSIENGIIDIKNSGTVSNLKLYCEVSNAHYTEIISAPHASYSGNVTITLPTTTGTLALKTTDTDLVNDTSPQLGGALDLNGNSTINDSNSSLSFTLPSASGTLSTQSYATGKAVAFSIVFGG